MSSGIQKRSFIADFKKYLPMLINLSLRDIKIKYRRSVLGILWSVLNPLFTMLVLTTVFGMLLKIRVENFATYYIVGASLWTFFSESTTLSMSSVIGSAALIKKVYVPKYMFPLEKCIFAFINYAFSLIAVVIVMIIQGVYPTFNIFLSIIPILLCFVFCCGLSLFFSAIAVYFRDVLHLYSVLLTVWMYLTPILYPLTLLEEVKAVYIIARCNPMVYFVEYLRYTFMNRPFFEGAHNVTFLELNLFCIGFAALSLIIGWFTFKKAERNFILHI